MELSEPLVQERQLKREYLEERLTHVVGLVCFLSCLRVASSSGSEPFTQVYTMSIGSSGHRLRDHRFIN